MLRSLFSLSFVLAFTACPSAVSTQEPAPDQGSHTSDPESDAGGGDEGAHARGAEGNAESEAEGGAARRPPGPELPSGSLCDTNSDCGQDQLCEGIGCESGAGRCVAKERICTRDLAEYCGCEGQIFTGSGSCPGGRYAYRGSCEPAREDGEVCTDGRQCRSGQCVGEGLEGCSSGAQGVCGQAACTKDIMVYCGCNNTEFSSSGSCPNRQFAYRGRCEGG